MVTALWSGLAAGAIYALVAVGYNVVFIASGLFNFAQAALVMVGTYFGYVLLTEHALPYAVAIVAALVLGAVLGIVEERIAIRPLRGPNEGFGTLVTTIAVSVIFAGLVLVIWGTNPFSVPFATTNQPFTLLGGRILPVEFTLIVVAVVMTIALELVAHRTAAGLVCLAAAEDPEAAALRGINVKRLTVLAFALAGAIGTVTGILAAPKTFATYGLGNQLALEGFLAVAIGGFGSFPGALIGGFVVGIVGSFGGYWLNPEWADLISFVLLLTVLLIRPTGLFGTRTQRMV
jgi:branched-chain amino acid transport system permease protein